MFLNIFPDQKAGQDGDSQPFCNAPDDNPFMAGAFLGGTEADAVINVRYGSASVMQGAAEVIAYGTAVRYR